MARARVATSADWQCYQFERTGLKPLLWQWLIRGATVALFGLIGEPLIALGRFQQARPGVCITDILRKEAHRFCSGLPIFLVCDTRTHEHPQRCGTTTRLRA
jgi:hypothetical protein